MTTRTTAVVTLSELTILEQTMAGLEAGLLVLHIATFDPLYCRPDDDSNSVLEDLLMNDN